MRDYRDAKVMAQTARTFLADHGLRITHSQSVELIAKAFGAADWNTLSAASVAKALPKMLRHHRLQSKRELGRAYLDFPRKSNGPSGVPSAMERSETTNTRR